MIVIPFLDAFIRTIHPGFYHDVVDRLHYLATCNLLIFFSLVVCAKQYVGQPIQCWLPAEARGGWEEFVENICFTEGTYYADSRQVLQKSRNIAPNKTAMPEIRYYQWVPIMLAVQAFMFYVPYFIWKTLHNYSGLHLKSIMKAAKQNAVVSVEYELRSKNLTVLARIVEDAVGMQQDIGGVRSFGALVTVLFLFVKFLNLVNVVAQFYILDAFLGMGHDALWGWQLLRNLQQGRGWLQTGAFPRITFCDFNVQGVGNVNTQTVPCVLMVNLINEPIYIFMWFWFFFVAVSTAVDFFYWIWTSFYPPHTYKFVESYLRVMKLLGDSPKPSMTEVERVKSFIKHGLRHDGVLLLRLMVRHAGVMITTEFVSVLYKDYKKYVLKVHDTPDDEGGLKEYVADGDSAMNGSADKLLAAPYPAFAHGFSALWNKDSTKI